jgi:hypothetical protein
MEVLMGRSAHYREQADRCMRLAGSCIDPTTRERLLMLAAENASMAEGLARGERQQAQSAETCATQQQS